MKFLKKSANALLLVLIVVSSALEFISFLGSFYFPFISKAYATHPTALILKRYWYFFLPGDFLLLASVFLSLLGARFLMLQNAGKAKATIIVASAFAFIKGILNTYFYRILVGGLSPSFINVFTASLLLIVASVIKDRDT